MVWKVYCINPLKTSFFVKGFPNIIGRPDTNCAREIPGERATSIPDA